MKRNVNDIESAVRPTASLVETHTKDTCLGVASQLSYIADLAFDGEPSHCPAETIRPQKRNSQECARLKSLGKGAQEGVLDGSKGASAL